MDVPGNSLQELKVYIIKDLYKQLYFSRTMKLIPEDQNKTCNKTDYLSCLVYTTDLLFDH